MPRPSKKTDGEKKVLFHRLHQIWTGLAIEDWLAMLCDVRPESRWYRSGRHIKGRCPFHEDSTASFIVTPSQGIAKCFGCAKGSWFNPVKFAADINGVSFSEAIILLKKRFGVKVSVPDALYEKARDHEAYQKLKLVMAAFCSDLLSSGMESYPNLAPTDQWLMPACDWLVKRNIGGYSPNEFRKQDDGADQSHPGDPYRVWNVICANRMVGVFPPLAVVIAKFGEASDEYKFFRKYFHQNCNDSSYIGAVMFMSNDEPGSISRFKMRQPGGKDFVHVADDYEAEMGNFRGFFGLNYYRSFLGGESEHVNTAGDVLIVEGEFDALAIIGQQIRNHNQEFIALSSGGGAPQSFDRLAEFGITTVRVAQDKDNQGESNTAKILFLSKSEKLGFQIFQWPDEYAQWNDPSDPDARIHDPDEAIKRLGYPKFRQYALDNNRYWYPHAWCFERAAREINRVNPEDTRQRSGIAKTWGKLLTNKQELDKYCNAVGGHFDMSAMHLFRDILAYGSDEEAYVLQIAEMLQRQFHFIGVEVSENQKCNLRLYNKERRTIETVVLNDERSFEMMIARYGGTLYEFVRDNVGDPSFLAREDEDSQIGIEMRAKRYRVYVNFALMHLVQGLPNLGNAETKAQGMHFIKDDADEGTLSYIVNGLDVYKMTHLNGAMKITALDGPSDNGLIFNNRDAAWLPEIKGVEDFTKDSARPADLFRVLRDMVNIGWAWKHQSLDSACLAAYTMCLAVMPIFSRQTAIMLTAEHQSGKSRFISGFLAGNSFKNIRVLAHSVGMSRYTEAGIRQKRNNSTLLLCLEEMEDYGTGDKKSLNTRSVLELFRDQISESAIEATIGTQDGRGRSFSLRFALAICAIRPLRDAASLSRFIGFELVKDDNRVDPVVSIVKKYSAKTVADTRRALAISLLPHIPRLRQLTAEIEAEHASGDKLPSHATARFREAIYPIAAMMHLVRELAAAEGAPVDDLPDANKFMWDFTDSRKDQLQRLRVTAEHEQLIETILSSPIHIMDDEDNNRLSNVTTIRNMLGDLNHLDDINKTHKGIYFDKAQDWLVVSWIEASQGVLMNSRYRFDSPTYLKQISERSPLCIPSEQAKFAGVLKRLQDPMGAGQKYDLVSVFSVKALLDETRKTWQEAKEPPAAKVETQTPVAATASDDDDDVG